MKLLKILLGIFIVLGITNCILCKNILIFCFSLVIIAMLLFCVRANRKNGQYELLDILNTSWFILCESIPLFYKFVYKTNIFDKISFDKIFNFTLMGPMIILILTGFGLIRVKYKY